MSLLCLYQVFSLHNYYFNLLILLNVIMEKSVLFSNVTWQSKGLRIVYFVFILYDVRGVWHIMVIVSIAPND